MRWIQQQKSLTRSNNTSFCIFAWILSKFTADNLKYFSEENVKLKKIQNQQFESEDLVQDLLNLKNKGKI